MARLSSLCPVLAKGCFRRRGVDVTIGQYVPSVTGRMTPERSKKVREAVCNSQGRPWKSWGKATSEFQTDTTGIPWARDGYDFTCLKVVPEIQFIAGTGRCATRPVHVPYKFHLPYNSTDELSTIV